MNTDKLTIPPVLQFNTEQTNPCYPAAPIGVINTALFDGFIESVMDNDKGRILNAPQTSKRVTRKAKL
jgi:hypothetical protein